MFIFPLRTMAPCPYPPVVTLCLLGVMLLCSTMGWLNSDLFQAMKLSFQNIHMINWASASLFHPSVGHFLLNALFIWVFGQLLEGRMGPATFLCVVSILIVVPNMFVQLFNVWLDFQGREAAGAIIGSSGLVYGLMALAIVYGYDHEIELFVYAVFTTMTYEVGLWLFCVLYAAMQMLVIFYSQDTTAWWHCLGFVWGAALGILMTMAEIVPVDGSNLFESVFGLTFVRRKIRNTGKSKAEEEAEIEEKEQREWIQALPEIVAWVEERKFAEVQQRMTRLLTHNRFAKWDSEVLRKLIQGHIANGQWLEANHALQTFESLFPEELTPPLILGWAHVKLELGRPRKSLEVLRRMQGTSVRKEQKEVLLKLAERAKDMIRSGLLEPDE
jgi:membrane associated rhomboid family serine protease